MSVDAGPHATPDQIRAAEKRAAAADRNAPPVVEDEPKPEPDPVTKSRKHTTR